jgi:hypothetical protein
MEEKRKGKRAVWETNRKIKKSHEDEWKSTTGAGERWAMHMASGTPKPVRYLKDSMQCLEAESRKDFFPIHLSIHGISRNLKDISAITCVSTGEKSFLPYIMTSQDSACVRKELKRHRARFEMTFISKANMRRCLKAGIYISSIWSVFFPDLAEFHKLDGFVFSQPGSYVIFSNGIQDTNCHSETRKWPANAYWTSITLPKRQWSVSTYEKVCRK